MKKFMYAKGPLRLTILVIALWVLWCAVGIFFRCHIAWIGQFGDSFGSLNALFTGAALISVAYSMRLQLKQISELREEKLASDTKHEKERYDDTFEARFFHLTAALRDFVKTFRFNYRNHDYFGRHSFEGFLLQNPFPREGHYENKHIDALFGGHVGANGTWLLPYFAMLENVLWFVDSSRIQDKSAFIKMLMVELSPSELILLAVWSCQPSQERLLDLVVRYHLLEGMVETAEACNFRRESMLGLFNPSAFSANPPPVV